MMTLTSSYLTGGDQVSSRSKIFLQDDVEILLEKIYWKHNHSPINLETRRKLSSISKELAFETLRKVFNKHYVKTLDGLIRHFVNEATSTVNGSPLLSSGDSPVQPPRTPGKKSCRPIQEVSPDLEGSPRKFFRRGESGGSMHIPQLLALGELEFKKVFLLLRYIGGKSLSEEVISADEIRQWKDLPMVAYESAVWFRLGQRNCSQEDRRMFLESDSGKTHYYQCHVATNGSYRFKGPYLENTGTHLHKVLGDDNVLTVKFDELTKDSTYCNDPYPTYKEIAKNGIMVGLRRYQFFVFKDGGNEGKKKKSSTKQVKCYFIRTSSQRRMIWKIPISLPGCQSMKLVSILCTCIHCHLWPTIWQGFL